MQVLDVATGEVFTRFSELPEILALISSTQRLQAEPDFTGLDWSKDLRVRLIALRHAKEAEYYKHVSLGLSLKPKHRRYSTQAQERAKFHYLKAHPLDGTQPITPVEIEKIVRGVVERELGKNKK